MLSKKKNGLGALTSSERPIKGKLTGFTGFLAYYEICKNGYRVVIENLATAPYAYKDYDWISYDDMHSLQLKVQVLVKRKCHLLNFKVVGGTYNNTSSTTKILLSKAFMLTRRPF